MEKNKKIMLAAGVLLIGGIGYYVYTTKKKGTTSAALAPSPAPVPLPSPQIQNDQVQQIVTATNSNTGVAPSQKSQAQVTAEYLAGKKWKVYDNVYDGKSLNIRVLDDGTIFIGDGYQGKIVGNTIVTYIRHGVTRKDATVWTPLNGVSMNGIDRLMYSY